MPPPSASSTAELQRDLLVFLGLRMRLHRIGLSHWQAGARLRSWGVAPLHLADDRLLAPCGQSEALWLGCWLDDEDGPGAAVELSDRTHGGSTQIGLPADFQLTALRGADGTAQAIARPGSHHELKLSMAGAQCVLALLLQAPADWAHSAGREAPPALTGPPPPPPRYA